MIDRMDQITQPAQAHCDFGSDVPGAKPNAHEILDNSLTSIIGNARMIALDNGASGEQTSERLAAIIDNARKISLIVHQHLGAGHPKAASEMAGQSQPRGRSEDGAGECPCWI